MKYKNPVISGFHPDPSVCAVGEDYYLVNSSFEYFPGIPLFHSKNLVDWKQIGHVLTRDTQLQLKRKHSFTTSQGIYAPTIRYHKGRFYVIANNVTTMETFYVWADSPEGPWSDPVVIRNCVGYDPSLLFDENGKVYLTIAGYPGMGPDGIYQAELDIETGEMLSEIKFIWEGTGGKSPEGPHLYKINEWYYLMIAEGGTEFGHMETIARSKNPYGPFESHPNNPILSNRSTDKAIQATGHADLVQTSDGNWWGMFLGIRPVKNTKCHHLGRETHLAAVKWTEDGWPMIGENGKVDIENNLTNLLPPQPLTWKETEDFDCNKLSFEWNFFRHLKSDFWSLSEKPGWLTLYGQDITLNDNQSPTLVARRQQHFNCKISTLLEFSPKQNGEEAGLTVFMNEKFHYEIIKKNSKIILRRRVGSMVCLQFEQEYYDSNVIFEVKATELDYQFVFINPDGETIIMGTCETSLLSTQVAGGFTGVYFGLYATGNGKYSTTPAHFDYFKYEIIQ